MNQFADVVALTNGDPKKSLFTYAMPDFEGASLIQKGSLVKVPYGKKEIFGVVFALHDTVPAFATKPIAELVYESPVLTDSLITLAQWMADYYHEPLRNCIDTAMIFKKKVRIPKSKSERKLSLSKKEPVVLTREQQFAYDSIISSLNSHATFLLHGITGSGKTEIYLRVMQEVLAQGKQIIYLVPEIALTPQTIKRIEERFPGKTSVLNSQVSDGERYQAFLGAITGEKPIVIGSRSALFTPFPHIGLIIIDEEHDHSFKQESSPRYHAVETAAHMASDLNIPLILGSATPRVKDYYATQHSEWKLLTLSERALNAQLPKVKIVDMREELKKRNFSTLSDDLENALRLTLEKGEQALLFLNKRGVASSLMCRMCGWTAECPRCSIALTLHHEMIGNMTNMLVCHHCDYQTKMVLQCPDCESLYIKPLGSGTERVEQDLLKIFPQTRILRMDRDTTTLKGSHEKIYSSFLNHEADVLIGTQMITKGWDIPNVTMVGIVNADTALHMPNFSAAETSFSLITQVAGRAGRAGKQGSVVLQSYNPDHYAVTAAAMHDYMDFYTKEIAFRKSLNYPPFSQLVQLVYCDEKQEKAEYKAEVLFKKIEGVIKELRLESSVEILGPSTGLIPRLRNKWYYQILIKGIKKEIDRFIEIVPTDWTIDVDPTNA